MELHHFLGLFRVITESEVVGCRELIEYDEPITAKKIPVLRLSEKERCRVSFQVAILSLGFWCVGLCDSDVNVVTLEYRCIEYR